MQGRLEWGLCREDVQEQEDVEVEDEDGAHGRASATASTLLGITSCRPTTGSLMVLAHSVLVERVQRRVDRGEGSLGPSKTTGRLLGDACARERRARALFLPAPPPCGACQSPPPI